ncbi:MAG TPA: hypothetical protein DEB06_10665 [Phycisphaerales bacterium]|nr:hypothetical protein [Phycisphaerales bacterium]
MLTRGAAKVAESPYRRTIHLSEVKRTELMDRLDAIAERNDLFGPLSEQAPGAGPATVRVTVHHPGGGSAKFLVISRHFSERGMWFLHSGFLNPGTRCVFVVPRGDGQEGGVLGMVETCELLERSIHAVAVRFDSEVDPDAFRASARFAENAEGTLELPQFDADLLLLDDQRVDCELLAFHLRSTGVRMASHDSVSEAIRDLRSRHFDLVMCELNLSAGPGEEAIGAIRRSGYEGPIIVLTAEANTDRLSAARRAGAAAVVPKPYSPAGLIRVLAAALGVRLSAPKPEATTGKPARLPLYSTRTADAQMIPLVEGYIAQVHRTITQIADAVRLSDAPSVRRLCLSLKGSGAGFGFGVLSDAAERAVKALDSASSLTASGQALKDLSDIAHRLAIRGSGSEGAGERD